MPFHLHAKPRSRAETRARIAQAVTQMSCRISTETLDATLRAAQAARKGPVQETAVTELAVLASNARHLGRNVDTILWTSQPDAHAVPAGLVPGAPFVHRSLSVTAVIHKFATLSEAFSHLRAPAPEADGELCEEPAAG